MTSLSSQTCLDFTVYIGDDASPYDIQSIVAQYEGRLNIVYHRFCENLGGTNLVGQWERCIALSQDEPWIWLFSDDDEMESKCVENFFAELRKGKSYDLYHFNIDIITETGGFLARRQQYPTWLSSKNYIVRKLKGEIASYVVEYIFSRNIYERCGGFQNFDLAWNSDDATWVKFGLEKGIKTVDGAKVKWRRSSFNISPNNTNKMLVMRKVEADLEYLKFLNTIWSNNQIVNFHLSYVEISWFCSMLNTYKIVLNKKEVRDYLLRYSEIIKAPWLLWPMIGLVKIMKIRHG